MSRKRRYHATYIKDVNLSKLEEAVSGRRMVFGMDIGKEEIFGALMNEAQEVVQTVKWKHPQDVMTAITLLEHLPVKTLEVAMEPTGTYGDALLHQLLKKGIAVYQIHPKRTHDAIEVYDGVASSHDAKSAAIVAKLHLDGLTRLWEVKSEHERDIAAAVEALNFYKSQLQQHLSRLEAKLARYWPEVTEYLKLDSATLITLLEQFGSAQQVAINSEAALKIMQRIGGHFLELHKREAIVRSAQQTIGVVMLESERAVMQSLASEMQRIRKLIQQAEGLIKQHTKEDPIVSSLGRVIGVISATALIVMVGEPHKYETAGSYVKGMGINLTIHESGKYKGQLRISKRGPGGARHYLYYAVLRLIQHDAVFNAWYAKKVRRLGDKMKGKAIVALMRKLARGLWHVGRGAVFDSSKLFDTRRLQLQAV